MLLLNFTAQNHKSLRDEAILELARPSLSGVRPRDGQTWASSVYPAAGIFGANASGKSTILDALRYAVTAVRSSASEWLSRDRMPRAPFRLGPDHTKAPSRYELEFVHEDTRFAYGFEVDEAGVAREWLADWPSSRRRSLFTREREQVSYGRGVRSVGLLASGELLLSRAIRLSHEPLAAIGRALVAGCEFVPLGDRQREARIEAIVDDLSKGKSTTELIKTVLRIADVGIVGVTLREEAMPPEVVDKLNRLKKAFEYLVQDTDDESSGEPLPEDEDASDLSEPAIEAMIRGLEFDHGYGAEPFSMYDESDGTLAWLALAVPAIDRLRKGGLFVVDELGSSLHPHLAEALIGFFQNPEINTRGAQILFTSHDFYLISNQSSLDFEKGQIWFTDKERDGATEPFSLADFKPHHGDNVAKRYLEGRYGAVPSLAPSLVHLLTQPR